MLSLLKISQFAIVESLELELKPGFSVLTGETGAGKSILMDALSLCLGDRADAGMVRAGAERAEVSACFDIARHAEALVWLRERDLDQQDECWLRRTINADGRSRAFINGSPSTLADLRELGEMLIDVHSQHEHQTLLRKESHRSVLDAFAGLSTTAAGVASHYQRWQQAAQRLHALQTEGASQAARLDLLGHQLSELDQLALREGEYQAIEQEYDTLANLDTILAASEQGLLLLTDQEEGSATQLLQQVHKALDSHRRLAPALAEAVELVDSARIQVAEAASALRHYRDGLDTDPARLQHLEERLSVIHQLARKHRVAAPELTSLHARLQDEFEQLSAGQDLETLVAEVRQLEQAFVAAAQSLRQQRTAATAPLAAAITQHLRELGMSNARLLVQMTPLTKPQVFGLDDIELLFSANPGQPPKSLGKVASGGELSRISLAIQVVNACHSAMPAMVFDEVDVGIGGAIAEVVGRLLRDLGKNAQVLCITHQPQVAALGHHHLLVSKQVAGDSTSSSVRLLSHDERIQEIARMSGGLNISPETLRHAQAMLAN